MTLGDSEEALLGFDAREMSLRGLRKLDPTGGRPLEFLLRTDLDDVLSADTMVWPSVFRCRVTPPPPDELTLPAWIGLNVPFWDDLDALRSAIPSAFGREHPFRLIAATWHTDVGFSEETTRAGKILGPYIARTTPERRDSAWQFLGFDITDSGISGLTNCGYDSTERDVLAAQWGRHLNRYHLFDDLDRAFEFRTLTNARVPEHAPFFVIGLWLVGKTTHE